MNASVQSITEGRLKDPETFDELKDWLKSNFQVVHGVPRAYMEIPIPEIVIEGKMHIHREVYAVLAIGALGPREDCEGPLVRTMHASLSVIRDRAIINCGYDSSDDSPLMFVRRDLNFETNFAEGNKPEDHKITIRCSVPGVDLTRVLTYKPEGLGMGRL